MCLSHRGFLVPRTACGTWQVSLQERLAGSAGRRSRRRRTPRPSQDPKSSSRTRPYRNTRSFERTNQTLCSSRLPPHGPCRKCSSSPAAKLCPLGQFTSGRPEARLLCLPAPATETPKAVIHSGAEISWPGSPDLHLTPKQPKQAPFCYPSTAFQDFS